MIKEGGEPGSRREIMHGAVGKMLGPRLRAGQLHALMAARGPPAHGSVRDIGVELERVAGAVPERLHRESVALGD
jgi:hypothetical protein